MAHRDSLLWGRRNRQLGDGGSDPRGAVLIRAFAEQGYVEGKNVVYVTRNAGGRIERLSELAAEVAGAGVDVIVTTGSEATRAAKQATATIPIVFLGPSYPVEEGLVATFARPGGNITGITLARVNMKTAKAIDLAIPSSLLLRADEVIN